MLSPQSVFFRERIPVMRVLVTALVLVLSGCAMPMAVNQHLDALACGLDIAEANAGNAHDMIERGIASQRVAAFDAARSDLSRIAATQAANAVPIKTATLVVEQLEKQSAAYSVMAKTAWTQRLVALDNLTAMRRILDQAKAVVVASQNVSQELKDYIGYLQASRQAAELRAAAAQAAGGVQ